MKEKKVGDTVWVVSRWRKEPGASEVITKVGRQYLHTNRGHKITREALAEGIVYDDNYTFYPSEEAHALHRATVKAQVQMMDRMKRTNLTLEQVQAINALLGWTEP